MLADAPYIRAFVESGDLVWASREQCRIFAEYLDELPWNPAGTRIDWRSLGPSARINLAREDPLVRSGDLEVARCRRVLVAHSAESGVLGTPEFIFAHLDDIFGTEPGPWFLGGVSETGTLIPGAVAEYDGSETLKGASTAHPG